MSLYLFHTFFIAVFHSEKNTTDPAVLIILECGLQHYMYDEFVYKMFVMECLISAPKRF